MNVKELGAKVFTFKTPWTYLYLFLIPFINWCFAAVPQVALPDGGSWTPMAIVTGLVLVVRDFAQREISHWIIGALVIGLALSFLTSDPAVALASTCAFAVSELVDWAVYTFIKRPLSERVAISTALSAPLDSVVFYAIASTTIPGIFNIWSLASSVASKLAGVAIVYFVMRRREQAEAREKTS
ncbi:hypothetical protein ABAC460_21995 [Asticcacaulis sp. AC460]|uniref:VUT family protein n=1 Tax=Asticcacaulis sp. AC460 TaxID=1282360 RepID=UPI0003C3D126|nr:VUT family protein [Asticcacaulis sp. AC460]ESQ86893.1 hypothetical protein ABAC460_21995 [Asticcacaulis sp. AC460]